MSSCWFTGICFREVLRLHWWISAVLPTNAGGSVRAWLQSVFSVFHASSGVHVEAKVCLPQPSALFTALFFSLEQCILVHFCGKCGEKSHFGDDQTARGKKKKGCVGLKKKVWSFLRMEFQPLPAVTSLLGFTVANRGTRKPDCFITGSVLWCINIHHLCTAIKNFKVCVFPCKHLFLIGLLDY